MVGDFGPLAQASPDVVSCRVLGSLSCFFFPKPPRASWTPSLNFLSEELSWLLPFVSDPLSAARPVGTPVGERRGRGEGTGGGAIGGIEREPMLMRLPGPAVTARWTVLKAPASANGHYRHFVAAIAEATQGSVKTPWRTNATVTGPVEVTRCRCRSGTRRNMPTTVLLARTPVLT